MLDNLEPTSGPNSDSTPLLAVLSAGFSVSGSDALCDNGLASAASQPGGINLIPPTQAPTPSSTPTQTLSPAPTSAATPIVVPCVGDCGNSDEVTVDEILTMVKMALGNLNVTTCVPGDADHDGQITVDEILTAVNNALNGCPK